MNIGLLQVSKKQKPKNAPESKAGALAKNYCALKHICREGSKIEPGELHAVIVQGNKEGKKWYKRLHLKCLPIWAEYSYNYRRKPKGGDHGGGRPKGSGPLNGLNEEQLKQRHKAIRERARLLRRFQEVWLPNECKVIWERIKALQAEISSSGVSIQRHLQGHRSDKARQIIQEKIDRLGLT